MSKIPLFVVCDNPSDYPNAALLAEGLGITVIGDAGNPVVNVPAHPLLINYGASTKPSYGDALKKTMGITFNSTINASITSDRVMVDTTLHQNGLYTLGMSKDKKYISNMLAAGHKMYDHGLKKVFTSPTDPEMEGSVGPWSRLQNKDEEYRVFIAFGAVVDIAKKVRATKAALAGMGLKQANPEIRTYNNGWRLSRKAAKVSHPMSKAQDVAKKAINFLGLDFGSVDVMVRLNSDGDANGYHVIKVSSAPSLLVDKTYDSYITAFSGYIKSIECLWAKKEAFSVPGIELLV